MVEREFYKMDQDVLHEGPKSKPPAVSTITDAQFEMPRTEALDVEPRILPPASFPAFPAPEGVVASRPPPPEPPAVPAPVAATTSEPTSSEPKVRSDVLKEGVPGRDG